MNVSSWVASLISVSILACPAIVAVTHFGLSAHDRVRLIRLLSFLFLVSLIPWGELWIWNAPIVDRGVTPGGFSGLLSFLCVLWVLGAGIEFGGSVLAHSRWLRTLRLSRTASPSLQTRVDELAHQVGVSSPLAWIVPEVRTAATPLSFRSELYLSDEKVDSRVLRHELEHIKNRDLLWMLLSRLLTSVIWFHPGFRRLEAELLLHHEIVADLAGSGKEARSDYARLLLAQSLEQDPSVLGVAFGWSTGLERRILALQKPCRTQPWGILAVLAFSILVLGFGMGWQAGSNQETPPVAVIAPDGALARSVR